MKLCQTKNLTTLCVYLRIYMKLDVNDGPFAVQNFKYGLHDRDTSNVIRHAVNFKFVV